MGRSLALVVIILAAAFAAPAEGHGPCRRSTTETGCLRPAQGPAGTRVTITAGVAYRVVWNENVVYFGDAKARYRPLRPIVVVAKTGRPREGVEFVVPNTEPGTYPVAIYDGSEAGAHYTWDVFTVTRARPASPRRWLFGIASLIGILFVVALSTRRPHEA